MRALGRAERPSSRPRPDPLTPPNGAPRSRSKKFTPTAPASTRRATSRPRATSLVQTGPAETVVRIVREAHRVVDVVVREDSEHGPEDLLPDRGGVRGQVSKDGGLDVPTPVEVLRTSAARNDAGAFGAAGCDE